MIIKLVLVICILAIITHAKPQGYEPRRRTSVNKLSLGQYTSSGTSPPQCDCKCPTISNNGFRGSSSGSSGSGSLVSHSGGSGSSSSSSNEDGDYRPRPFSKTSESEEHVTRKETNIVEKEFYTYNPPQDVHEKAEREETITNRKKIRVLFIRAPENDGVEQIAQKLAKSVVEDQTHVYVLTKQVNSKALQQAFEENIEIKNRKPEIHFVKFATEQDAIDAQQRITQDIENQYDGESSNIEGGEASLQSWSSTNTETTDDDDSGDGALNIRDGGSNGGFQSGSGSSVLEQDTTQHTGESICSELGPGISKVVLGKGGDRRTYGGCDSSLDSTSSNGGSSGGYGYSGSSSGSSSSKGNNIGISSQNLNNQFNFATRNGYLPPPKIRF